MRVYLRTNRKRSAIDAALGTKGAKVQAEKEGEGVGGTPAKVPSTSSSVPGSRVPDPAPLSPKPEILLENENSFSIVDPAKIMDQIIDDVASFDDDPLGYAQYAWDWEAGDLEGSNGPRAWQGSILELIGKHLKNPQTRFQPCRIAVASGHGIGKTAEIGMIIKWAMDTCAGCKVVVTANTDTQLRTKTWPEVSKWFKNSITADWFNVTATSIRSRDPAHADSWRADAIPWNEANTEAFQGLHNLRKRIVVIYDEASGVADKIWEVTEGALTDEDTEIIWIAFGNPTKNNGRFRECFGKFKHLWHGFQIDAREVEGTNKVLHAEWIRSYGEDSDFCRVRIKGQFPRAGSMQFISDEAVSAARGNVVRGYETLPKIISVDVARFGDDLSVIMMRQGRLARLLGKYSGLSTVQLTDKVIEFVEMEAPDGVVVDGDGIGGGVCDQLVARGLREKVFEFHGGATPNDAAKYFNRRSEMWGLMGDWLPTAQIPDMNELANDLVGPQYGYNSKNQIQLERKEDMKRRGLSSPDFGDALAMSFSVNLLARRARAARGAQPMMETEQSWMAS